MDYLKMTTEERAAVDSLYFRDTQSADMAECLERSGAIGDYHDGLLIHTQMVLHNPREQTRQRRNRSLAYWALSADEIVPG